MLKKSIQIISILMLLIACKQQQARRPKQHSTSNFYEEVIAENKKLNALEKARLEAFLKQDTTQTYIASSTGFWYTYNVKDTVKTEMPEKNDIVEITFNITDVLGNVIYPTQQKTYKVDKEDFIPGLQDGIKLMKQGETITFVIPSYRAFGVTGDGNKIGINQPIKSTLTINKLIKNEIN